MSENREFFEKVFAKNAWRGKVSRSGTGSEGRFATQKIEILRDVLKSYEVRRVLDIGCGDFYWMHELVQVVDYYVGLDIVPALLESNRLRYESNKIRFCDLDLTFEEAGTIGDERWDLVVCIDVIGHLLNEEVSLLIEALASKLRFRYLLVTNRRNSGSRLYLEREKSRHEGIDLELHPMFAEVGLRKLLQLPALYPDDFFDFYERV